MSANISVKDKTKKSGILYRPRIENLFADVGDYSAVLVTAGAGYGKTQAVLTLQNREDIRTAWLHLSKLDNLEDIFWRNFLRRLSGFSADTIAEFESLGFPDTLPKFKNFMHSFAREIYAAEQFILVLDDFHLISAEPVRLFVQNLIDARFENFCIILISREKVNLDLPQILDSGKIKRIGPDELRFTPEETREYLTEQGLDIPENDYAKIQKITGGWPLALYLISLSLRSGKLDYRNPIAGAMPLIFEMIEREIYLRFPPEIQKIFMRLSLLDSLPAGLIKELSGDFFGDIFEILDNAHFARYDFKSERYEFHHLFLEFLIKKQIHMDPAEINRIYRNAADWYLAEGDTENALSCCSKGKFYDQIWDIISKLQPKRRTQKRAEHLIALLDELPAEFVKATPMVRVMRASFLLNNWVLDGAREDLLLLVSEMEAHPENPESLPTAGEAYIILAFIYLTLRDYRFVEFIKKADKYLPEGSIFDYTKIRIIDSNDSLVPKSPAKKDIDEMLCALFDAVPVLSRVTHGLAQGGEYLAAAEYSYYTGDFKKTEEYAFQAIYRAKEKDQTDIISCTYFLMMRLTLAKGNYKSIIDYHEKLRACVENSPDKEFYSILDMAEGWLYLKLKMEHKIARWIVDESLGSKTQSPISAGRDKVIRALSLLAEGKYYELLAYLPQLEKMYHQKGLIFSLSSVILLKTIASYELDFDWIKELYAAYEFSIQSNFTIHFREMGWYMRKILDTARNMKGHKIPKKWLDDMYAKASTYSKRQSCFRAEYEKTHNINTEKDFGLTKREKEVLQNLCQGLTREEIAASMYISVGTVKNSLNNIYSKLGALNNIDAIRIAIQNGVIDS